MFINEASALEAATSSWNRAPKASDSTVELVTNRGTIRIRLLQEEAPIHVASFLAYVREGFYDGLI